MFRKSLHEYLFSQQEDEDIYSRYRQHKAAMYEPVATKHIEEVLLPAAAAALQKEISKIFNSR